MKVLSDTCHLTLSVLRNLESRLTGKLKLRDQLRVTKMHQKVRMPDTKPEDIQYLEPT